MSQASQDPNPIDPSVEEDLNNQFLSTIPPESYSRITFGKTGGGETFFSQDAMSGLIKYGASGSPDSWTGVHYLELGEYNGNHKWESTFNDAPGLKLDTGSVHEERTLSYVGMML
ncbi:hypothetical protein B9479_004826 [Cryptococcus floricola]|uniref:Uncharacterized protein n=1 Tax=Cryptococcus floricola TaxID=2591691 RepID=A0A5D3AUJ1_9TREE|nr:hypothetical protein B9479_004826 [Cryptococcus floricola]